MYDTPNYADRNIGPAFFQVNPEQLYIRSVFHTIQGEGPFAGTPAVFVRFGGCNRGSKQGFCEFCDTDFRIAKSLPYSPSDLVSKVAEKSDWGSSPPISVPMLPRSRHTKLVVITGGEPMLQPALVPFCKSLIARNYTVQIESNGDFLVPGWEEIAENCHLVVSPKIATALGDYRDLKQEVFDAADCLKILVDADESSPYHFAPAYVHRWEQRHHAGQIFLSPMAIYRRHVRDIEQDGIVTPELATIWNTSLIDQARTSMNYRYAAKLALQFGWQVSIQQHLFLGVA